MADTHRRVRFGQARICPFWICLLLTAAANIAPMNANQVRAGEIAQLQTPAGERYSLLLPEGAPAGPRPLVLALHYGGYSAPFFSSHFLADPVMPGLHALDAVIAAPDCEHGAWTHPGCKAALESVRQHVTAEHEIDPTRVLITGYSMGGIGTWELVALEPQRYSAAIIMAARPGATAAQVALPLFVIHGAQDALFPIDDTQSAVERIRSNGGNVEMRVLEHASHFDVHEFVDPLQEATRWLKEIWQR